MNVTESTAPVSPAKDVYVTYKQLRELHGIPFSKRHIRRLVASGRFPPPIMLGENTPVWRLHSQIEPWKESHQPRPVRPHSEPLRGTRKVAKSSKRRSLEDQHA